MIVDMLRNDLGRVAEVGSVEVARALRGRALPDAAADDLDRDRARAAPRSRRSWRRSSPARRSPARRRSARWRSSPRPRSRPRGVYTGAIGWAGPDGTALVRNVAIRTVRRRPRARASPASASAAASWPTRRPRASTRSACSRPASSRSRPSRSLETLALPARRGLPPARGPPRAARRLRAPLRLPARHAAGRGGAARDGRRGVGAPRGRGCSLHADGRVEVRGDGAAPGARRARSGSGSRRARSIPRSVWLYHKTTRREVYDEAASPRAPTATTCCCGTTAASSPSRRRERDRRDRRRSGSRRPSRAACCPASSGRARSPRAARARRVVRITDLRPGQRLWLLSARCAARARRAWSADECARSFEAERQVCYTRSDEREQAVVSPRATTWSRSSATRSTRRPPWSRPA